MTIRKEVLILTAVEYRHIGISYGREEIFHDFNLKIERGEFVSVIGPSGCGKTTLLKMVNGLVQPTHGDICINGQNIRELNLLALRRNIGYAIQGNVLFPHYTVGKNIAFVPNLLNKKDKKRTREAVLKWMSIVGLDESLLYRYPDELSGGQQQRVGIARALAASPDILLMDEPFSAVDEITREVLQKEICQIHDKTGITILFVTHSIQEALNIGTKVLIVNQGAIQQYAAPEELLNQPANDFVKSLISRPTAKRYE